MGWVGTCVISPSGKVHPAHFFKHDETCAAICEQEGLNDGRGWPSMRLAQRGYIKLTSEGRVYSTDCDPIRAITQAQYDALWDMVEALNEGRIDDGTMTAEGLLQVLTDLEVK